MTMLQAYVLTTLLPNLQEIIEFIFMLSAIFVGFGFLFFAAFLSPMAGVEAEKREDIKKCALGLRPLLLFFIISGVLFVSLPSEKQIAATLALTYATTQEAQEIYGEAGQFVKEWLKQQTQELQQEVTE